MTDRTITEIPLDAIVEHPDQPRYGVGGLLTLADSIENVGLLEPVLVVGYLDDDAVERRYRVLAGHRRVAAMRNLGRTEIPAVELAAMISGGRSPDVKELDEIAAIMASNVAREALTPLEEARGYQTMLDLGLKAADVAKLAGTKKKHVDRLSTAIKKLGRERADGLAETQLTVEEMEGLARFAGNEKRYKQLIGDLGKPGFAHTLSRLDWKRKGEEKKAATLAQLEAEGCPVVDGYLPESARLIDLKAPDGERLTPENHAACSGHAAQVGWDDVPVYLCCDWKANGHEWTRRAYQESSEGVARREARREKHEAFAAAMEAATAVRHAHIAKLLSAKKLPGEVSFWATRAVWDGEVEWMNGAQRLLALELLGWKYDESGTRRWAQDTPDALPANLTAKETECALVAVAMASIEESAAHWERDDEVVRTYLRLLSRNGYELAEVEREIAWPKEDGVSEDPVCGADSCAAAGD